MNMRILVLLALLASSASVSAQVYRWVDDKGRVTYSNSPPPAGVKPKVIDIDAKPGAASPDTQDCYSVRCQGERMERRIARRDELDTRLAAERAAAAPPQPRGLDFRNYLSIRRGMSEGELLGIAGSPDHVSSDVFADKRYTYMPTSADPFTTTITLIGGRITDIDRVRKF